MMSMLVKNPLFLSIITISNTREMVITAKNTPIIDF